MDLEMMCETTLSQHRERIAEAARRARLRKREPEQMHRRLRSFRGTLAVTLRRLANALEPQATEPRVLLLRAVAHGEVGVDQAMELLQRLNGRRSRGR